jgi:phage I-like protein
MRKFYSIIGLDQQEADTAIQQSKFIGGGKKDTDPAKFANRIKAVNLIYKITYNNLKSKVSALNDKGEANYIQDFLKNLDMSIAEQDSQYYEKLKKDKGYSKLKALIISLQINFINIERISG